MKPLVSICIPTYNGERFLKETLNSILTQSYSNIEIVISDDASIDNTLSIIEEFKDNSNFPTYIYNHKLNGIGANWNNCIKKANGVFIKFLFQDDILKSDCIESMTRVLVENKEIALVASKRDVIYKTDYDPGRVKQWTEQFDDLQKSLNLKYVNDIAILDMSFFKHKQFLRTPMNKIGEPTAVMFKKEITEHIGLFREDLKQILDYEFYYRVLKSYKIGIINKSLVKFRLHEKQATNLNKGDDIKIENEGFDKILYNEYLDFVDSYIRRHLIKKYNIFWRSYIAVKVRFENIIKVIRA